MIIQTKFDVGEEVYLILNSKLIKAIVYQILIGTIKDSNVYINYEIIHKENREYYKNADSGRLFSESWLFKTKKELINSL